MNRSNKHGLSRDIPADVKRKVRQRCGFGCVICGAMFCEYHHFNPSFREAKEHNPANITLLCPKHHADCGRGRLSDDAVEHFNNNPISKKKGAAKYLLEDLQYPLEIVLGNLIFVSTDGVLLISNGCELLSIKNISGGPPLINALFGVDSSHELKIIENEIVTNSSGWDIETKANEIVIRDKARSIALGLEVIPPKRLILHKVNLNFRGNIFKSEFEKGIYMHGSAGPTLDLPGYVIVAGGRVELSDNKIQITGGTEMIPMTLFDGKLNLDSLFFKTRELNQSPI